MAASGAGGGRGAGVRAGRAFVEISADLNPLQAGLDSAKRMVLGAAKGIAAAGGGLVGLGGAVFGPLFEFFRETVDRMNEIRKAADQLGTTTEIFSGLGYAAKKVGVDTDGLVAGARRMQKSLADAAHQGGAAAKAFEVLGINANDILDLPLDQQFAAVADGLANLSNAADQSQIAMAIFGRSGVNLLPTLRQGGAGLAAMAREAEGLGLVISTEDAVKAKEWSKAVSQAKGAIKGLKEALGASLLAIAEPAKRYSDIFVGIVRDTRKWVDENRQLVLGVAAVAAGVIAAGVAFIGIGSAMALATVAVGGIVSAIGAAVAAVTALISPFGAVLAVTAAVAAGVAYLGYLWVKHTESGQQFAAAVGQAFTFLGRTFSTAWQGISTALQTGDFAGAMKVALAALDVLWAGLKVGAVTAWNEVKGIAVDRWNDIIAAAAKAFVDMQTSLRLFGTDIKGNLLEAFQWIFRQWKEGWKTAISVGLSLVLYFAKTGAEMIAFAMTNAIEFAKKAPEFVAKTTPPVVAAQAAVGEVGAGAGMAKQFGKENAQRIIRAEADLAKAKIDQARAAQQAASDAARAADLDKANANLKEKEKALQDAVNEVMQKKWAALSGQVAQAALMAMLGQDRKRVAANVAELAGVRGQFGGQGLGAALGVGDQSIPKKQLEALEGMDEKLGRIEDKIGGLAVE